MNSKIIETAGEIGGYFGLELPYYEEPFPGTLKFQSSRAALRAAIESAGIKQLMLPDYICGVVNQAVVASGVSVETYQIDELLYPKSMPFPLPDKCALLYVNYFGLSHKNVERLLQGLPNNQLIIDNSQALFARPTNALATIYSPRKFIGVPDGGLLVTSGVEVKAPVQEDADSFGRMKHLLLRMAYTAQEGYADYLDADESLGNSKPLAMSRLTRRILASIDMTMVKQRRRENYLALAVRLDGYNSHQWELDSESVPLCYPLVVGRDVTQLKKSLRAKGIYIPTYWPDAKPSVADGIEHRLKNFCLAVPCDQRYTINQMSYLADEIIHGLDSK